MNRIVFCIHCNFDYLLIEDLVYIGDSQYGIRVARQALERCEKTAKTPEKLALNLLEVVLTPEEISTCTLYGNTQHKKEAIEDKKRKALRSNNYLFIL